MINHKPATAAEKKVTLSIQDDEVRCSDLHDLVTGGANGDRLRGVRQHTKVSLYLQPRSDVVVRRIFFRGEIDSERAMVKRALLHAASNLTPERLKRIGSPGRLAVLRVQQRAARPGRHDIKVDHVFSDISLLANGGRKRSFLHSPAKAIKSSSRLRTGAVGLAASHSEHLVRLYHFCLSAGSVENLPVLLRQPQDQNQDIERILCCIALFRTVACNFLAEEKSVQYADKNKLFDGLRASMKGDLPYLFIDRWRMARKNGLINERSFEWVPAVDWLVDSLQPEKKPASRRARKPNSPRSPASPSPTSPSPASLPSQPQFSPLPLRQASRGTSLQPGRQAATVHIPKLPDSPSWHVLKARNNKQGGAVHVPGKNRAAELHGRHFAADRHNNDASSPVGRKKERPEKTAKLASTPGVPAVARRQQTLQDMLYLASMGKSLSQTIITVDVVPLAINEEGNADT